MSRYFLVGTKIEGFRGINNEGEPLSLTFQTDSVNSIHAQNGIGKSSIHEAICYAIFGALPKLDALQRQEQPDSYYVNRFHTARLGTVELTFRPDDGSADVVIVVTRNDVGVRTATSPSGHADPEAFLASLAADFTLVDSTTFAKFIDSTPLERGRSFSSLLGLTRYAKIRHSFERASDTRALNSDLQITPLATQIAGIERRLLESQRNALATYQEVTGSQVPDLSNEAGAIADVTLGLASVATLAPVFEGVDILGVDIERAREAIISAEGGPRRAEYQRVLQDRQGLEAITLPPDGQSQQDALIALARERDAAVGKAGSAARRDLFRDAERIVNADEWPDKHLCPVCEQRGPSPLPEALAAQIEKYQEADRIAQELEKAIAESSWFAAIQTLEAEKVLNVEEALRQTAKIKDLAEKSSLTEGRLREFVTFANALVAAANEALSGLKLREREIEAELPPSLVTLTQKLEAGYRFGQAITNHRAARAELREAKRKQASREKWRSFITKAATLVGKAESALSAERISQIETTYQTLFRSLMRGGPDMKPQLKRAMDSENVELNLENFYGEQGVTARAVLSESYRNAVAASIFLAAAVKQTGAARFMVLDDITSSFDGGHQFALMEALRLSLQYPANPDGLQFVVLSHDTLLEKYFDRTASNATGWSHQKLQGAAPTGKVFTNNQQAGRLRTLAQQQLQAGMLETGAPLVRQYLEFQLGQIISKVSIPVPIDYAIKSDNRTVGNALDAIQHAVDLYKRAGTLILDAQQVTDLNGMHVPAIIANYVSHYETGAGGPIVANVLLGVLQSVDDMAECFRYTPGGANPQRKWYKTLEKK